MLYRLYFKRSVLLFVRVSFHARALRRVNGDLCVARVLNVVFGVSMWIGCAYKGGQKYKREVCVAIKCTW